MSQSYDVSNILIFVLYFYIFIVEISNFKKELKSRTESTEN